MHINCTWAEENLTQKYTKIKKCEKQIFTENSFSHCLFDKYCLYSYSSYGHAA